MSHPLRAALGFCCRLVPRLHRIGAKQQNGCHGGALASRALGLSGLLGLAVLFGCPDAHADEPVRVIRFEPDAYPESGTGTRLMIAGLASSAAWYGLALGPSLLWPDAPGAEDLRIPVAGPWLALADTGCAESEPDCSVAWVVFRAIVTAIDGVGQAGGLAIAAEGLFMPTRPAANSAPLPKLPPLERDSGARVRALPTIVGRDGVGIGVVGQF